MSIELQAQAKSRILIVDDSGMNRMMLSELLEDRYDILEASNGVEALALIRQNLSSLDLVLLDIVMPELDGFGVLAHMKKCHWLEFIPVIMISSEGDSSYIEKAFNLGASDYIQRPYKGFLIHRRIMNTLGLFQRQRRLVGLVEEQVYENEKNSRMMINILGHIVEFRNGESGMHIHHIQVITKLLLHHLVEMTDAYPLSESDIAMYSTASALHDIGKISIDGDILNKPGRLTPEEFEIIKTHALIGAEMLEQLPFYSDNPLIHAAYEICRWHHERYDGRGYPDGLKGEEIPISAQVTALADVYDALTSVRCYKAAIPHEKAMEMILDGQCGAFNPLLLQCLKDVQYQVADAMRSDGAQEEPDRQAVLRTTEELLEQASGEHILSQVKLLEQERLRQEFFTAGVQEIQFVYDAELKTATILRGAAQLGTGEVVVDRASQDQSFLGPENMELIREKVRAATPEQPEVNVRCLLCDHNGELHWRTILLRVLFTERGGKPVYTSLLGRILPPEQDPRLPSAGKVTGQCYSDDQLQALMEQLRCVFDVVRLVDPEKMEVLDDGTGGGARGCKNQQCHAIWGKGDRCKNCISLNVLHSRSQAVKLEFVDDNVYAVFAKYVQLNGQGRVLEMVYKIREELLLEAYGRTTFMEYVNSYNQQFYQDVLTGAYNRRFYEEQAKTDHIYNGVVMIDGNHFKQINDQFGHAAGDAALRTVAQTVLGCIRSTDRLVRYGGDEFILLLVSIPYDAFQRKLEEIVSKVARATPPGFPHIHLGITMGGVYDMESVEEAVAMADRLMYQGKRNNSAIETINVADHPDILAALQRRSER